MLRGIGMPELIIILVIVILIFGASRLTDIGGALGQGIKEFRSSVRSEEGEEEEAKPEPAKAEAVEEKEAKPEPAKAEAAKEEEKEATES